MDTAAPDGRPLTGDIVRLDRLVASDLDSLYAAIGNEQVYAGGFGGGPAGMPADVEEMREQWLASSVRQRPAGGRSPAAVRPEW